MARVVLVGAGRWGSTVARRMSMCDVPLTVVAVVDAVHGAAESVAHSVGAPWYGSHAIEAAVADTAAEWAVVAIPHGDERQRVCEELRAVGVENIRVEKPFVEGAEFVDAVGHQTLFAPEARLFRELVRADGASSWLSVRTSTGAPTENDALDLAVHDIAQRIATLGADSCGEHHTERSLVTKRETCVTTNAGHLVTLDEVTRSVTLYKRSGGFRVWDFAGTPDPLGIELRAWANLETGWVLDIAARAADEALAVAA